MSIRVARTCALSGGGRVSLSLSVPCVRRCCGGAAFGTPPRFDAEGEESDQEAQYKDRCRDGDDHGGYFLMREWTARCLDGRRTRVPCAGPAVGAGRFRCSGSAGAGVRLRLCGWLAHGRPGQPFTRRMPVDLRQDPCCAPACLRRARHFCVCVFSSSFSLDGAPAPRSSPGLKLHRGTHVYK
jgi:hypothetical protein